MQVENGREVGGKSLKDAKSSKKFSKITRTVDFKSYI